METVKLSEREIFFLRETSALYSPQIAAKCKVAIENCLRNKQSLPDLLALRETELVMDPEQRRRLEAAVRCAELRTGT